MAKCTFWYWLTRVSPRFLGWKPFWLNHTGFCKLTFYCHSKYVTSTYSTLSPISTGMGDCLRAGISPRYVTKPTRSTQPCIPPASWNQVPALIGWGKGKNVTSAGWQVPLYDPIWYVSSCSYELLYLVTSLYFTSLARILLASSAAWCKRWCYWSLSCRMKSLHWTRSELWMWTQKPVWTLKHHHQTKT